MEIEKGILQISSCKAKRDIQNRLLSHKRTTKFPIVYIQDEESSLFMLNHMVKNRIHCNSVYHYRYTLGSVVYKSREINGYGG